MNYKIMQVIYNDADLGHAKLTGPPLASLNAVWLALTQEISNLLREGPIRVTYVIVKVDDQFKTETIMGRIFLDDRNPQQFIPQIELPF